MSTKRGFWSGGCQGSSQEIVGRKLAPTHKWRLIFDPFLRSVVGPPSCWHRGETPYIPPLVDVVSLSGFFQDPTSSNPSARLSPIKCRRRLAYWVRTPSILVGTQAYTSKVGKENGRKVSKLVLERTSPI